MLPCKTLFTQRGPDSAIYNHAELYPTPGQIGQLKSKGTDSDPVTHAE